MGNTGIGSGTRLRGTQWDGRVRGSRQCRRCRPARAAVTPSLVLARPFVGDEWTLETTVTYAGFQQPGNGRVISLWVAFGDHRDRDRHSVQIYRYSDNPDRPRWPGTLAVTFNDGLSPESLMVALNRNDSYIFRITRRAPGGF